MAEKYDICSGAMPFRCLGDRRLTALHFRVLGVIATHDRLSRVKGGQGCWAGQKRIAGAVGTGKSHVSEAIADLSDWGYLKVEKGKGETRKVYRVVYTSGDWDSFRVEDGEVPPVGNYVIPPVGNYDGPEGSSVIPPGGNFKGHEVPENRREVPSADTQLIDDIKEPRPKKGRNAAEAGKNSAEAVSPAGEKKMLGRKEGEHKLPDGTRTRVSDLIDPDVFDPDFWQ